MRCSQEGTHGLNGSTVRLTLMFVRARHLTRISSLSEGKILLV